MKKTAVVVSLLIVSLLMLSCGTAGPAGPAGGVGFVMQFQNGVYPTAAYAGAVNTGVDSNVPNDFSASPTFWIGSLAPGAARYLVKYDLTLSLPNNAVVTKAYLTITVNGFDSSNSFSAYQLTGNFVPANTTWANKDTGTPWTTAGGDFAAAAKSNSVTIGAAGKYTFILNAAMVQAWINNSSVNYGMLLKAFNETAGSNDAQMCLNANGVLSSRPMLTVYYTLP
jgi:hypothetical protein